MKKTAILLLLGSLISVQVLAESPSSSQGTAGFRNALDKGNSQDPEVFPLLERRFKPIAQGLLPNLTISSVTIDPRTGEVLVTGTDANGKIVTVKGSDIDGKPSSEFGMPAWITCAWHWFTSWGSACPDTVAPAPGGDIPVEYDAAQEKERHRVHNLMTGSGG